MLQKKKYWQSKSTERLPMFGSEAFGLPLVKDGCFGADMIFFDRNQSTEMHTHLGDHILFVAQGSGYLIYEGIEYFLDNGDCYFVPGNVLHKVGTKNNFMRLLSVANNHQAVDSPGRMEICDA